MRTFVSHGNRITVYDQFLANPLGSLDLGRDYAISFAGYHDKTLAGTVSGRIFLVSSGLEEVTNLGKAITCLESDGEKVYAVAGTKEFVVLDGLDVKILESVDAPGLSCIDAGEQVLVGGHDGNLYQYEDSLEKIADNPSGIVALQQYQNFTYLGLMGERLRVLNGAKQVVNLDSKGNISGFTTAGDNLYFSLDNQLWKVNGHVLEEKELLKKYRKKNMIRNLQSVSAEGEDYLVLLYDDDIYFMNKDMKTEVVRPKFGKDKEKTWGVFCHA